MNIKCGFIFFTMFVWNISHSKKHCLKNTQISNFMKFHPVGAEVFHVDVWADMTKISRLFAVLWRSLKLEHNDINWFQGVSCGNVCMSVGSWLICEADILMDIQKSCPSIILCNAVQNIRGSWKSKFSGSHKLEF
jgi:hypothetical protein